MYGLPARFVITEIEKTFTVMASAGTRSEIPSRARYGFTFCVKGKLTYTHKGKEYVEDPQHAVLLPKGETYRLLCNEDHISPVINFDCLDFLCDTPVVIPIEDIELYKREYDSLQALCLLGENPLQQMSLLYHMLHRLLMPPVSLTLSPAIKYLKNHYQDPNLSNEILAQQCCVSETYFRRLFLEQYKTTPRQFLIDFRIEVAKQLLSQGSMKMVAVSEQCGFSNPYHFSRAFKQKVGLTPTEFMMCNRNTLI